MYPLAFFGLGAWEITIIGMVALLLFGPRLPKVARALGQSLMELKKGLNAVNEIDLDEPRTPRTLKEPRDE